jgi:hypothetical protein
MNGRARRTFRRGKKPDRRDENAIRPPFSGTSPGGEPVRRAMPRSFLEAGISQSFR